MSDKVIFSPKVAVCATIDVVDTDPMKSVFVLTGSGRNNLSASGSDLFYALAWEILSFKVAILVLR